MCSLWLGAVALLMLLSNGVTAPLLVTHSLPTIPSEATLPLLAAVGMLMPFNKSKTKQEHPVLIPILRRLYRVLTNENRRRLALKMSSMIETALCLIPWTSKSWISQYPLNIQQELQRLRKKPGHIDFLGS